MDLIDALSFTWVVVMVYALGVFIGRYQEPQAAETSETAEEDPW